MIQIILPEHRDRHADLLDAMFRMRYEVVVKQWGWKIPGIQPGYDRDLYDTDHTVYMLYLNDARDTVLGSCRFNPTTEPYMISELWQDHCDLQPAPAAPDVWETSRFVIINRVASKEEYLDIMWHLGVGLTEYCQAAGIKQIVWFTDFPFYATIRSIMEVEPLGRACLFEDDDKEYFPAIGSVTNASVLAARANLADPLEQITFSLAPIQELPAPFLSNREAA